MHDCKDVFLCLGAVLMSETIDEEHESNHCEVHVVGQPPNLEDAVQREWLHPERLNDSVPKAVELFLLLVFA